MFKLLIILLTPLILFSFDIQVVDETKEGKIKSEIEDTKKQKKLNILHSKYGINILKMAKDGKPIMKSMSHVVKNQIPIIIKNKTLIIESKIIVIKANVI